MTFPNDLQCFAIAILVFVVVGFMRGWRREAITLIFVMLGVLLIRPDTSRAVGEFLSRLPATFGYLTTGSSGTGDTGSAVVPDNGTAPWWSLILFAAVYGLGFYIGIRAFPKPSAPQERFIGIIPAVISGAFIINYLTTNYVPKDNITGQRTLTLPLPSADTNIWPIIIFIVVAALLVAFIATRIRKATKK